MIAARAVVSERYGTVPTLVMLGSTTDIVAGCCYVFPDDVPAIVAAKRYRLQVEDLLEAIRGLTFSEFESFGARVLAEIGATFWHVTPHSGDQGIDFYGKLSLGEYQGIPIPFAKLAHDVILLFAGQAKHYPNRPLGTDIVRELIGAISLARTRTFSRDDIDMFPGLELKPFAAMVPLLFSTGRITSGAIRLAEAAGIIARSGEQIAVFLADKGVGMKQTTTDAVFDPIAFKEWLCAP
jgi:hypothetical protein